MLGAFKAGMSANLVHAVGAYLSQARAFGDPIKWSIDGMLAPERECLGASKIQYTYSSHRAHPPP